jgi:hypothetical protein
MDEGFKVCDAKRCLSKKPMSEEKAKKQRIAVALSINRTRGVPLKEIFSSKRK